jgi:hypothetical protein
MTDQIVSIKVNRPRLYTGVAIFAKEEAADVVLPGYRSAI